ncbi:MAG: hypothetical protein Q8K92_25215 [Leadbetterella sp.]|nr:hypothetical protein [Leadbetterella sp.]
MKKLTILGLFLCSLQGMAQKKEACCTENSTMACKLTSAEFRERKETVIANLKKEIVEKKELKNGIKYTFKDSDETINMLTDFIKTERQCCDFFNFEVSVSAEKKYVYLALTGPKGVKDFIKTELSL